VCENCLVDVHESCVVQTYLSWLTDSDYDPKCLLCSEALSSKETIRLKCLHNFHWSCLSSRVGSMPVNTPASAYKCPSCLEAIFPAPNQTSPVIERLKQKLSTVNWARVGLGLEPKPGHDIITESNTSAVRNTFSVEMGFDGGLRSDGRNTTSRVKQSIASDSRPLLQNNSESSDSKYVKRNASMRSFAFRIPKAAKRATMILLLLGAFYLLLMTFGRDSVSDINPVFDPHANPNIRVE